MADKEKFNPTVLPPEKRDLFERARKNVNSLVRERLAERREKRAGSMGGGLDHAVTDAIDNQVVKGKRARGNDGRDARDKKPEDKDKENAQTIQDRLVYQETYWMEQINNTDTQEELDKILMEVAGDGKKHDPCFTVGKPFNDLLQQFPVKSAEILKQIREKSQELQRNILKVYRTKAKAVENKASAEGAEKRDSKDDSHEEEQRLQKGIDDLFERQKSSLKEIEEISSHAELDAFEEKRGGLETIASARREGKMDEIPEFDEVLREYMEEHSLLSDDVRKRFRDTAIRFQEEIEQAFVAKKESITRERPVPSLSSEEEKKERAFLSDGERAFFKGTKGELTLDRKGEMYQITDEDGKSGFIYDEEYIRSIAREEEWKNVLVPDKEKSVEKADDENRAFPGKEGVFHKMKVGEEAQYFSNDEVYYRIQKRKDGYYILEGEEWTGPHKQEALKHRAEDEGWTIVEEKDLPPEPLVASGAVPLPEQPGIREEIDGLRSMVAQMRLEYVTADYDQSSAWKKLKSFFGKNISNQPSADVESAKGRYEFALVSLQEKQLEALANSGLKGEALKKEMAGLLQYFKYDERVALFNARTEVRSQNMNLPQKAIGLLEEIGRQYNKLSKVQKILIAVTCLAGASALAFTGGAAGAAAASGIVGVRRILVGVGTGVSLDTLVEGVSENWKKRATGREIKSDLEEIETKEGDDQLRLLNNLLKLDIEDLNKKFKHQKNEALWRKTAAWTVGIGSGMLISNLMHGHSPVPNHGGVGMDGTTPNGAPPHVPGTPNTPSVAETPRGTTATPDTDHPTPKALEKQTGVPDTEGKPVEKQINKIKPEVKTEEDVARPSSVKKLLQGHRVTEADGKKGLWGIIEKRLPSNLPPSDKNRVIQSLENAMQKKLELMSPAELKAAGIPSGDLDQIQIGKVIKFENFLSSDDIEKVLSGKSILAPAPSIDVVPAAPFDTDAFQAAGRPDIVPSVEDPEIADRAARVAEYDRIMDTRSYLQEHPEKIGFFNNALGKMRMEIFLTNDVQRLSDYSYVMNHSLGSTQMSSVIKDVAKLENNAFASYDRSQNPLHYSQMKELTRFMEATQMAFKDLAQVGAGESIDDYTKRMTTVAFQTGKAIPGFYKP